MALLEGSRLQLTGVASNAPSKAYQRVKSLQTCGQKGKNFNE